MNRAFARGPVKRRPWKLSYGNQVAMTRRDLLVATASASALSAQDFSRSACEADFDTFLKRFEENYAFVDQPHKPWLTWRQRYGESASANSTREGFATVIANALFELHDFHAEVRSRVPNRRLPVPTFADIWAEWHNRKAVVTAVRRGSDAERAQIHAGDHILRAGARTIEEAVSECLGDISFGANPKADNCALLSVLTGRANEARTFTVLNAAGTAGIVSLPVQRKFDRPSGALVSEFLSGGIGLIRFNNSLGDQSTVNDFDETLGRLRATRALILDLRDVPSGGNSAVALGMMGRFIASRLPYQRHRIPHYGQPDVERNWTELVAPRGPSTYTAPLAVLVDHWTGSMGEGIAIGFDAMNRGIVIGTPMAHLAGAVSEFILPKTGTKVAFATEQLFHVNGTPREMWLPPVLITDPVTTERDPVLNYALSSILRKTKRARP
jgi:hypothetical protein